MRCTEPAAAGAAPPSTRSRLVLPAPLRPTRPTLSRARTEKVAPDTTKRPPTSTASELATSTVDQGGSADPPSQRNYPGAVELRASRPALAAGAAAVAAGYVALADPARAHRLPTIPCPIHTLTGWWCPGCGMTRAAHDVLTGHLGTAFGSNLLWPL